MILRFIIISLLFLFVNYGAQAQVVANYRFDDCKYTGASFEVLDQTGTYSATSYGGVNTFEAGKIELAANISSEYHHFETAISLSNQFSVSTWFKKPTSTSDSPYFVLGAMQAGGDLLYLDRNNSWRWGIYNVSSGSLNGSYSFSALDNNWHHMALVYSGGQTQLYIDGTLKDTINKAPSGTLKYIATSFDDVGGSNPQGFRAPLDEFIVFDTALTAPEVVAIYSNQNSGNNFDGSSRDAVSCPTLIAEYRFDETEYSDTPNEIIDSFGGFNGQARFSQPIEGGVVCNAIDLSASGTGDYAILDESIVNGKTDFTVSLWAKSAKTANQSILSGAGANNNEMIMWFNTHNSFQPHLKNGQNGAITTASIADNVWHHLVWTRQGSQSCLYQDNAFKGCVTQSTQSLSVQSLILGQEQDSVGGSFDSSQAFEGLIDEVLVFDSAISSEAIDVIYDNQFAGLGYDGSVRACPPPPPITPPVLDLRFDENDWSAANSVLDSSGNDFHATSNNVSPAVGLVCNAADMTVSGVNDYITLDKRSLDARNKFSISLWYKTPKTTNQSLISGSNPSSFNELIMWFSNSTTFSPFLHESTKSITTATISDDEWHHLVWTRSGSTNLFYRDGFLQTGSAALSSQTLDITSLILGQEQDSIGGSFDSSQAVEGLIDELLIFDRVIFATEVNEIYGYQKDGFNYDGSVRACPPPPPITPPILDLRFDEDDWSAANSVLDSSGNDFHATATNVLPTLGQVCNAADMTASGIGDYITLDNRVLDTRINFTISLWHKSPKTTNQSLISGSNPSSLNELIMWFTSNTRFSPFLHESTQTINTLTIADDEWHHLVWTRAGSMNKFYRDGVLQTGSAVLSAQALDITSLILGQEQDSIGGSFDSSQAVEGLIDELIVFDRAIPASEVVTIFDNQTNGLNYDGSVRNCASQLVLNMRFDEISWSGDEYEVIDETGNFNGQAKGGVSTANSTPARIGNPGTCRYGSFDGINDYVEVADDPALDLPTELSITTWIMPESIPSSGLKTILSKDENYEFHVNSSGEIFWWWGTNSFSTSGAGITAGNWYHVAITYKSGKQSIYVNGVEKGSRTFTGNLPLNNDPLQIGQDQYFSGRYFHGFIDEVSIYSNALSATDVNDIYLKTHPCTSYLDHFEISHDGQGLTCEEENITIKACEDLACSTLNNDTMIVQLSINGTPNKFVTVAGGTTDTSFAYTSVGTAALSLDQAYQCKNDASISCDVEFAEAGFIFGNDSGSVPVIPLQLSGKPSNLGFKNEKLFLQAVKTDDNTGSCVGVFPDGGDIAVKLSYTCHSDSSSCSNNLVLTNNSTAIPLTTNTVEHNLRFGTDSKAYFDLNYPDAGKLIVNAQKEIDVGGLGNIVNVNKSSNAFVVKPFGFKLDFSQDVNTGNAIATDENGSVFKKAGESFSVRATAVQWGDGEDSNDDGIPDELTQLNDNLIARHFDGETVTLFHSLEQPTPGAIGALTAEISNNFTDSIVDNTYNYNEVGIINLSAFLGDSDYLSTGNLYGQINNVGRFIPAYFTQSVESHGNLKANHSSVCTSNNWAYVGQTRESGGNTVGSISYEAIDIPTIKITAFNSLDQITQNYTEPGFHKLSAADIDISLPIADDITIRAIPPLPTLPPPLNDKVKISAVMSNGTEPVPSGEKGVLSYTFNSTDHFTYEHTIYSKLAPFSAKIPFGINKIQDSDLVKLYSGTNPLIIATEKVISQGVEVRFGRWRMENSFAPETSNLPMPMFIEQYNGTSFIVNPQESCITGAITTKKTSGAIDSGGLALWDYRLVDLNIGDNLLTSHTSASVPTDTQFDSGVYRELIFSAPMQDRQGSIEVEYQVPPWLQYDWTNDVSFTNNPRATLTFGLFRGNDRIIYQREVNN